MKRYFVKSYFSGWREVSKDSYFKFIENIRKYAIGASAEKKELIIKERTAIR